MVQACGCEVQGNSGRAAHRLIGAARGLHPVIACVFIVGCQSQSGTESPSLVVELTDANFQRDVIEAQRPVLVDFWAPWCQPCVEMAPAIETLAQNFAGKAKVGKLNVDEHQMTAARFAVSTVPTVLIFRDGDVIKRRIGMHPQQHLATLFEESLAEPAVRFD